MASGLRKVTKRSFAYDNMMNGSKAVTDLTIDGCVNEPTSLEACGSAAAASSDIESFTQGNVDERIIAESFTEDVPPGKQQTVR